MNQQMTGDACGGSLQHALTHSRAVLATALKRSQCIIKEVQTEMKAQQALHVQHCRQSAVDKSKMLRLTKLQRRVAELSSRKLQQRLQCVRAGILPLVMLYYAAV